MNLKLNVRHLELLELLPIYPKFLTVNQLVVKLANQHAYKDHDEQNIKRNLQRDLKQLEQYGITESGDSPEGLKWSLVKGSMYLTAQLSPADALCFAIIEQFIQPMMPNVLSPYLTRIFKKSTQILANLNYHSKLKTWLDKVYIENKGQPLIPAEIDNMVRCCVYDALLAENILEIEYKNKSGELSNASVQPLGLVVRAHIQYLIVQYCGYDDVRMLAMNRIISCENSHKTFDYPDDFNLKEYVLKGTTGLAYSDSPIEFEGIFTGFAAEIIMETPIAKNQQTSTYRTDAEDKLLVKASLTMNYDFETWLLGLANHVEVLKPVSLRNLMREKLRAAVQLYDDS
ncbi:MULTISPECIES: helix-turn-helix transcriptional regulator [Colwellia]|uniref:WYL domain-containing protein n=2 Tax=Gammaproteobacteria TaxID=1236 RepID=A0ABQ0MQK5_9GAMM|nr:MULTISPECIES: WYL domain-containing protein [Colwellia]GAW94652.1 WYL domain-containing protein [Colwellia marinimaniae]